MSIKRSSKSSWGVSASEGCSPAVVDPYRQLMAAILARACQDAQGGNLEAVLWLGDYDAELYCDVLQLHHSKGLELMTTILMDEKITLTEATNGQLEYTNA